MYLAAAHTHFLQIATTTTLLLLSPEESNMTEERLLKLGEVIGKSSWLSPIFGMINVKDAID